MKKQVLLILIAFIFITSLVNFVSASVTISINVDDFKIGEKAKFEYTFTSDRDEEIIYEPKIKCINLPERLIDSRSETLKKNVPKTLIYEGFDVTEETLSQQCLAVVKITSPFIKVKEEEFNIKALESIFLSINICKDKSCEEKSVVFLKNQKVYLEYVSDIEDLDIEATLTSSDGKTKSINLPYSETAKQIGTYEIEVTASKEGYKTITQRKQFGVIAKEVEIVSGAPTMGITRLNKYLNEKGISILWIIIPLIIFIVVIIFLIFLVYRKKQVERNVKKLRKNN